MIGNREINVFLETLDKLPNKCELLKRRKYKPAISRIPIRERIKRLKVTRRKSRLVKKFGC